MKQPFFKFYRNTEEIFLYSWLDFGSGLINVVPEKSKILPASLFDFKDIKYWEQIYHEPGNIGIYAAHDPHVEFYCIVYYPLHNENLSGIQTFYGDDAVEKVLDVAKQLGINLKLTPL